MNAIGEKDEQAEANDQEVEREYAVAPKRSRLGLARRAFCIVH